MGKLGVIMAVLSFSAVTLAAADVVAPDARSAPAAAAAAASKLGDPRGDTSPAWTDIRKISSRPAKRNRIRFSVRYQDANRASIFTTQVFIRSGGRAYQLDSRGIFPDPGKPARVRTRRNANRINLTVPREALRNPDRFKWFASAGSNDTSPERFDVAPDRGYLKVGR